MTTKLRSAIQMCEEDPVAGGKFLRTLMSQDQEGFLRAAAATLQDQSESGGIQELLKLIASSDQAVNQLCDPSIFSKEESLALVRRMSQLDPQLDTKLVRFLPGRSHAALDPSNGPIVERLLELLEAVSKCARIVPALSHLLNDPNPRIRAKAALLMGRRVKNTQLAESQMRELDPRVRANAIESLWGEKAAAASSVLWWAAKDKNNRVVGNALLGLYQAREKEAIPSILAMAADSAPLFRATAAWVMGQTADSCFLPVLEKMSRDLYASVRTNAAKSMANIRQSSASGTDTNL